MKKLLIIPILLFTISCSKSSVAETTPTTIPSELLGKWKYVEYSDNLVYNTLPDPHFIVNGYEITFNPDGTFVSNESISHSAGTFTVNSTNLILTYNVTTPNESSTREIASVTNTELNLLSPNYGSFRLGEKFAKITTP